MRDSECRKQVEVLRQKLNDIIEILNKLPERFNLVSLPRPEPYPKQGTFLFPVFPMDVKVGERLNDIEFKFDMLLESLNMELIVTPEQPKKVSINKKQKA
jgi:hypothetical protein